MTGDESSDAGSRGLQSASRPHMCTLRVHFRHFILLLSLLYFYKHTTVYIAASGSSVTGIQEPGDEDKGPSIMLARP